MASLAFAIDTEIQHILFNPRTDYMRPLNHQGLIVSPFWLSLLRSLSFAHNGQPECILVLLPTIVLYGGWLGLGHFHSALYSEPGETSLGFLSFSTHHSAANSGKRYSTLRSYDICFPWHTAHCIFPLTLFAIVAWKLWGFPLVQCHQNCFTESIPIVSGVCPESLFIS